LHMGRMELKLLIKQALQIRRILPEPFNGYLERRRRADYPRARFV